MATSCHYADALYSVGYTAVRKTSAAPFSAGGCSSVDDAAPLLQWPKITTRPTGNGIQSPMAWLGGGRWPSPKCFSGRCEVPPPSTSLASLGCSSCEFASYPALLVGSWPCTIADAAEPGHLQLLLSRAWPFAHLHDIDDPGLSRASSHSPPDIVDGRAWSSIVGSQLLFPLTASRVGAPASRDPPYRAGKSTFIDLVHVSRPSHHSGLPTQHTQPRPSVRDMPGSLEFVGTLQPPALRRTGTDSINPNN